MNYGKVNDVRQLFLIVKEIREEWAAIMTNEGKLFKKKLALS